jgi:predicted metalloprotease
MLAAAVLAALVPGTATAATGGVLQGWGQRNVPSPVDEPRVVDVDVPETSPDEPVVVTDPTVPTDEPLATGTATPTGTPSTAQVEQYLHFVTRNLETVWDNWFLAKGLPRPDTAVVLIAPGKTFQTSCSDQTGTSPVIAADFNNLFYCSSDTGVGADGQPAVGALVIPEITLQRMWSGDILGATSSRPGDFAAAVAVAHEYGHSVVDELATDRGIAEPVGKNAELIADCFAGVWTAKVDQQGLLEPGDLAEATAAFQQIGDTSTTGDPHGTAAERVQALTTGDSTGNPDTCISTYWTS